MADLPFDLGGGGADVDRIDAVFHSNSVSDRVIAKFNLMARYEAKYLEDAREMLWKHCATKIEKKASLLTLSCGDKVPDMARAMVAYAANEANQVARRTSTSSAGEERRFLEKRVAQAKGDLGQVSGKLREFQEQNEIISLPEQARAVVTSMATLRAEMIEKQVQLSFVDGFASCDESTSVQLRRQVGILEHKIKSLQEAKSPIDSPALGDFQRKLSVGEGYSWTTFGMRQLRIAPRADSKPVQHVPLFATIGLPIMLSNSR